MVQNIMNKNIFSSWIIVSPILACLNLSICEEKHCCSSLLLESDEGVHTQHGDRLGFYAQLGYYGARPAYRQQGGHFFLFYHEDEQHWIDSHYFYGATLFSKLVNEMDGYCLDDHNNWSFYNGSVLTYSEMLTSKSSKIEDVCCQELKISSANSEVKTGNNSFYNLKSKDSLGDYKAIGMNNGPYIYQKKNHDKFLEYRDRYWLASSGVGRTSGHIHHPRGSVCPEHIEKEWQISDKNEDGQWVWKEDPELKITCVKQMNDMKPKLMSDTTSPVAQPYTQIDPVEQATTSSAGAVVFGCISMLLLSMMIAFFARRFYRAWGRGSHGKQLLFETMDIE
eukprot:GFUD01004759.1.p1 GENE.GFUD01004759.1~~GFUD01004759.1.p1  ORF type:complete len:337 (+),score=61.88 GFUD01004759.1:200-1210(+)